MGDDAMSANCDVIVFFLNFNILENKITVVVSRLKKICNSFMTEVPII